MARSRILALTAAIVLSPALGFSLPFELGHVFASVGGGQVKVFTPSGVLVQTLVTGTGSSETTGGAFDGAGNFYVTNFQSGDVSKFDNNGTLIGQILTGLSSVESISVNQAGNLYVGRADGDEDVRYISPSGVLLDQFDVAVGPRGSDWVDLAADQQTLFYTSEGDTVRRYDVAGDTQLTDFGTIPGAQLFANRILSDGGLLVAGWTSGNVYRLNSTGALIDTFNIGGSLFALNLDPDGQTFWTADYSSGEIYRANISDGLVVTQFNAAPFSTSLAGLAIFGEIRQGGPQNPSPIPEPSAWTLMAGGLGLIAWRFRGRLHRR